MTTTLENAEETETSMSSEAYELINCFYDGIDDAVRTLAERYALEERSIDSTGVILIEKQHVKKAGCAIVDALKNLIDSDKLPAELATKFGCMTSCFDSK